MPKLTIDGTEIEVEAGTSVLQACEQLGIEIPRFCYHDRLSVPANCRMCLVEVKPGPPKPQASCALAAMDGMEVKTQSPMVHNARRGVMEFLLINHPLDCPICDQGGECDLQDQAMAYGMDHGRYAEMKRAVKEKELGPLIKTFMTRCIHCTRCVRFADEIAGVPEMGATERGENMEIGTYIETAISSELSGNMIDICPVGALTSKPYQFAARPWELKKVESIDALDAVGSNIRIDVRGSEVMRVLPRLNEDVNEEWISDKTRFAYDGLRRQRLDRPYRRGLDGKLAPCTWQEAFAAIAGKIKGSDPKKLGAIIGDQACAESMTAFKDLWAGLNAPNIDCRQDGAKLSPDVRAGYLFNPTIAAVERADAILMVGAHPRTEATLLNARIRKRYLQSGIKKPLHVGVIGENRDFTYHTNYLGAGPETLSQLVSGGLDFSQILNNAEQPLVIVGPGAVARPDGGQVLAAARAVAENVGAIQDGWCGFGVVHTAASRVGGLDLGLVPGAGGLDVAGMLEAARNGALDLVWLLGADEIDTAALTDCFVVYQGHHGDRAAHVADVILPGAAYTEKTATYVNLEGRVQSTRRAAFPPGDAREDWAILRAFSDVLGKPLGFASLRQVRARMAEINPVFKSYDAVTPAPWGMFGTAGEMAPEPFRSPIEQYYMTCPITRASETMANCIAQIAGQAQAAE